MTRKQLRQKVNELVRENNRMIKEKLEKLLKSDVVDLQSYEDDYRLPKLIMCAMAKEMIHQWKPLSNTKQGFKEIDRFYNCM